MTHSRDDHVLRTLIGDVVREQLGSSHVEDVLVRRDTIEDDDLLLITIIIDNADADIDDDDALALVSLLQPRLAAEHETAFPVISFSTAQEREDAA